MDILVKLKQSCLKLMSIKKITNKNNIFRNGPSQKLHFSLDTKKIDPEKRAKVMSKGLPKQKPIRGVNNIILVASGKGGVGKSTTAVNLATSLKLNYPTNNIGILDADVFGPTVPLMMNLNETPLLTKDNLMKPLTNYEKESPVIWRGLMVMQALEKLMRQVDWGKIDYLIIDTPPGTGDTLLSIIQNLPIAGVVLVTTPQSAALEVTKRGAMMFKKLNIPLIGIIENMSNVKCTSCASNIRIFGDGTSKLAEELGCKILSSLPLEGDISICTDEGTPIAVSGRNKEIEECFKRIGESVIAFCHK
nr:unnamed protein product [Callosobruchus analis]